MNFDEPNKRTIIPFTVSERKLVQIHEPALTVWDEVSDLFVEQLVTLSKTTNVTVHFDQVKIVTGEWAVKFAFKLSDKLHDRPLGWVTVGSNGNVSDLVTAAMISVAQLKRYPNYELIYEHILDELKEQAKENAESKP